MSAIRRAYRGIFETSETSAPDFQYLYTDPDEEHDMNSATFTEALQDLLAGADVDELFPDLPLRSATFSDAGVMTSNDGLVVTLSDGSEFQVTVVRSR